MGRTITLVLVAMLILSGLGILAPTAAADFPPPHADAGDDQTVGEGDEVTLDGGNSWDLNNDPLTFKWDFDDSNGSSDVDAKGKVVTTKYEDSGVYTVTLTVSDGDYEDTDTCRITVLPGSPDDLPPKAIIREPLPGVYNISQPVNFTGTGFDPEGDTLTGRWDFGDGKGSNFPETSHRYADEGAYHIRWTVTDGNSNNTAHTVIYVGSEIEKGSARRVARIRPWANCSRIRRRVGSANAPNTRSSSLDEYLTMRLNMSQVSNGATEKIDKVIHSIKSA